MYESFRRHDEEAETDWKQSGSDTITLPFTKHKGKSFSENLASSQASNKTKVMPDHLPRLLTGGFCLAVVLTLAFIYQHVGKTSAEHSKRTALFVTIGLSIWLGVQAALSLSGVYASNLSAIPPRILVLGIAPAALFVLSLFMLPAGRRFSDGLSLWTLTFLHTVRLSVEAALYVLAVYKAVPQLMTFQGRNFDVVVGITAPLAAYFLAGKKVKPTFLLAWHFLSLGLLANVVVIGLLSAPTPLQQWAFDQPNSAVLHFPFVWIPTFLVPLVLFAHLAAIRQLLSGKHHVASVSNGESKRRATTRHGNLSNRNSTSHF